jgi:hypothetical protein
LHRGGIVVNAGLAMRRLLFAMLAPIATAGASGFQPVDDIARAAEGAIAPSPGLTVEAAVDPGLRLPTCGAPLQAVARSANSVEVSCPDLGWRLYVPLRTQRLAEVWVLRRPVAAGEVIGPDAVVREMRDVARLSSGPLSVAQPLEGTTVADPPRRCGGAGVAHRQHRGPRPGQGAGGGRRRRAAQRREQQLAPGRPGPGAGLGRGAGPLTAARTPARMSAKVPPVTADNPDRASGDRQHEQQD